jgi:hypothetical protein
VELQGLDAADPALDPNFYFDADPDPTPCSNYANFLRKLYVINNELDYSTKVGEIQNL